MLKTKNANGVETETNDNQAKAALFADTFFPPPPATTSVPADFNYPPPLPPPTPNHKRAD
jgi:hypothetical protein